ncbi:putative alginate lyase [Catenovulum agarivorans DS-2]|uniref:Putative alginate lyase n=1 Tax=Catenovulum agarivorans DS-2 TaxID=1328313 RepID=W7Q8D3_9ALTE|nr:hypothetical protein [Catenovulum agarivorans]EWH08256.1 putative alginate lyase [Catenovulum agarivorans DS-2]
MYKSVLIGVSLAITSLTAAAGQQVGATLNHKQSLALADIPAGVIKQIAAVRPKFVAKEAEKEFKHGKVYIDVEGLDQYGNEIEFDMLQQDGTWKIVEIQRDLEMSQCPDSVVIALTKAHPDIQPKRIIESEQATGEIIYEFYTVDSAGQEAKYEVKLANGTAELLNQEWQH